MRADERPAHEIEGPPSAPSGRRHGVLLTVAYDGRLFAGWAKQRHARTIAGELEGAVRAVDPRASALRGVSRTDAGVHALGQLAAFDAALAIEPRGWVGAINRELPAEIAVVRAAAAASGFDPRRHARKKYYRYLVLNQTVRDPFLAGRAWRVPYRLNQEAMQREATALLGEHDFAAFRSSADERTETVRRIVRAEVRTGGSDARLLEIEIEGDRFLHNMVRIIAGTLVDVGRGRLAEGAVTRALQSARRQDLGVTAPPDGLYLVSVDVGDVNQGSWPSAD